MNYFKEICILLFPNETSNYNILFYKKLIFRIKLKKYLWS